MEWNEIDIRAIVEGVLGRLEPGAEKQDESLVLVKPACALHADGQAEAADGLFADIDRAAEAARKAQEELMEIPLDRRRNMIRAIRKTILAHAEVLSMMAVEETGFGRVTDKIEKHRLVALRTPGVEDLDPSAFTDEHGMTLVERAPYGVIGSLIPSTNPTTTVVNNTISMIAGGNAVVFHPHPGAVKCSGHAVSLVQQAIREAGGPENLVTALSVPSLETARAMMKYPDIRLLVVTGGPAVVREAMGSGKKVIAAGPGNPPCVVDETADLVKAGRDIVRGAGFDNNIVCICEKEILAVAGIADRLQEEMKKNGAFALNRTQMEKITQLVLSDPGKPGQAGTVNKAMVGKDAGYIASHIGLNVPGDIRILFSEVSADHPLVWTEQLLPVIPLVRFAHVQQAMEFAVECEHGYRHTAVMHSRNIANLSRMARLMNCSIFVKNGPSYSGLGMGGAGFTSFTIASPTGEGLTRARTFTRERRCTLVDYFRIV
ncbi:MAG TPA: aldehyde dehydrogenase family protein [Atribacteraceae bacterium]|nr:aldehyde dehydrogenase family protein [Atribacteraceae bacterium]